MRRNFITVLLFTITICVSHAWSNPSIRLAAVPDTERIWQTGEILGNDTADIYCAKNEYESIQIVVTADE